MRWIRFGGWLIAACTLLPQSSALAAPVMVVGTFQENFLSPASDTFTIMNAGSSATGILTVRYNLAPSQASFDPGDSPFAVISGGGTGFTGMFNATATSLTLNFTDFDPGETFSFRVDVDDNIGFTFGFDFEDSILQVVFDAAAPNGAMAAFVGTDLRRLGSATATLRADVNVPEPGTAGLVLLGFAGLLGARRRRAD
jgi:hypothetical protein